jgi:hypothetical protein
LHCDIQVYVKDESPPKKKITSNVAVATTANSDAEKHQQNKTGAALTAASDGLNSLVQAAGIQIVTDADGTRVQQYKCAMQVRKSYKSFKSILHESKAYSHIKLQLCLKDFSITIITQLGNDKEQLCFSLIL